MSAPYVPRVMFTCPHCGRYYTCREVLAEHVYYSHLCMVVGHRAMDAVTGECLTCRAARREERRAGRVREAAR